MAGPSRSDNAAGFSTTGGQQLGELCEVQPEPARRAAATVAATLLVRHRRWKRARRRVQQRADGRLVFFL
jgi:hypothetical protein